MSRIWMKESPWTRVMKWFKGDDDLGLGGGFDDVNADAQA